MDFRDISTRELHDGRVSILDGERCDQDGDVGGRGEVILLRATGLVQGDDGILDAFLLGDVLKSSAESVGIAAKNDITAEPLLPIHSRDLIDRFEELDHRGSDLAGKDRDDGTGTIFAILATFLAGVAQMDAAHVADF